MIHNVVHNFCRPEDSGPGVTLLPPAGEGRGLPGLSGQLTPRHYGPVYPGSTTTTIAMSKQDKGKQFNNTLNNPFSQRKQATLGGILTHDSLLSFADVTQMKILSKCITCLKGKNQHGQEVYPSILASWSKVLLHCYKSFVGIFAMVSNMVLGFDSKPLHIHL